MDILYQKMWTALQEMDEGENAEEYLLDKFSDRLAYLSYPKLLELVRKVVKEFYANYF